MVKWYSFLKIELWTTKELKKVAEVHFVQIKMMCLPWLMTCRSCMADSNFWFLSRFNVTEDWADLQQWHFPECVSGQSLTMSVQTKFQNSEKVKGKVVPVHCMKSYKGSRRTAEFLLKLGNGWRWVVNLPPQGKYPGTYWIGSWVGPKARQHILEKKNLLSCRDSKTGSSNP